MYKQQILKMLTGKARVKHMLRVIEYGLSE
jgi:hypothetical protein